MAQKAPLRGAKGVSLRETNLWNHFYLEEINKGVSRKGPRARSALINFRSDHNKAGYRILLIDL